MKQTTLVLLTIILIMTQTNARGFEVKGLNALEANTQFQFGDGFTLEPPTAAGEVCNIPSYIAVSFTEVHGEGLDKACLFVCCRYDLVKIPIMTEIGGLTTPYASIPKGILWTGWTTNYPENPSFVDPAWDKISPVGATAIPHCSALDEQLAIDLNAEELQIWKTYSLYRALEFCEKDAAKIVERTKEDWDSSLRVCRATFAMSTDPEHQAELKIEETELLVKVQECESKIENHTIASAKLKKMADDLGAQWFVDTQGPTTQPPATQPPATQPPATQPPATQPPATQPPATQPPATQPPTQPPTTAPCLVKWKWNRRKGKWIWKGTCLPIPPAPAVVVLEEGETEDTSVLEEGGIEDTSVLEEIDEDGF